MGIVIYEEGAVLRPVLWGAGIETMDHRLCDIFAQVTNKCKKIGDR